MMLSFLPLAWSVVSNPISIMAIIAALAFGYGHHRASIACAEREAVQHAMELKAHADELMRQAKAADAIAMADRVRAEDAAKSHDAMQAEIESLKSDLQKKGSGNDKTGYCLIDSDYIKRLQRFDKAGRR
jgi:predicted RND superfamily exporter protein